MNLNAFISRIDAVVITGASSGIGIAFIRTIARVGNPRLICNLSRTKPAFFLKGLEHFECDLADSKQLKVRAEAIIERLASVSGPLLLINNSGFGGYGEFPMNQGDLQTAMIDVNVRAMVDLTARLMPVLREKGGWILNMASIAGFQPTPYLATYGASKAFVLNWSLALHEECKDAGIGVLCVCPGPTQSNFFERAGMDPGKMAKSAQTAEAVVNESLLALAKGRSMVVTGWRNRCMVWLGSLLPLRWKGPITAYILKKTRMEHKNDIKSLRGNTSSHRGRLVKRLADS